MNTETISVSRQEDLPSYPVDDFVSECRSIGIEPLVERRSRSAYAGFEDYLPTALMLFMAKPFFDAFLKKAGEDAYAGLKRSIASLLKRIREMRVVMLTSGEKKIAPDYRFSRIVSVYSNSPDGCRVKFLFIAEGDDEYMESATEALCEMLRADFFPKPSGPPMGGLHLMSFDQGSKMWTYRYPIRKGGEP